MLCLNFLKIWQHSWLPIKHPPLIQSPIIESLEEPKVDFLIETENRRRNDSVIDKIFSP